MTIKEKQLFIKYNHLIEYKFSTCDTEIICVHCIISYISHAPSAGVCDFAGVRIYLSCRLITSMCLVFASWLEDLTECRAVNYNTSFVKIYKTV